MYAVFSYILDYGDQPQAQYPEDCLLGFATSLSGAMQLAAEDVPQWRVREPLSWKEAVRENEVDPLMPIRQRWEARCPDNLSDQDVVFAIVFLEGGE